MRRFGTQGRVYPEDNYVVPRTAEVADFINRIKDGKYIVLFAPRQTGKTTFFRLALDVLEAEAPTYFPIQLNFEVYEDYSVSGFYRHLSKMIRAEIEKGFETKIWRGEHRYGAGKKQLAAYLTLESADAGYYVVFDHRRGPESRTETEVIEGVKIRSYVIPVTQAQPSTVS